MDVTSKLRLIQEGFSIDDINSGNTRTLTQIVESDSIDEVSLFIESISTDMNYITEFSTQLLYESGTGENKNIFKRFIDWIIQKIRQFRNFIMQLFKKRKQEVIHNKLDNMKKKVAQKKATSSKPNNDAKSADNVVNNTLEKIINSPNEAIDILKDLVSKFEDEIAEITDNAYKGFNNQITSTTNINDLAALVWKKLVNNPHIDYDSNVTKDVIEYMLGGPRGVTVSTDNQIENIIGFANNFYDLWKEMDSALLYYEDRLRELEEFSDDGFKIVKLACETMLHVYPTIFKVMDAHINHLASSLNLQ